MRLGDVCHRVLDAAIRGRRFETREWQQHIRDLWDEHVEVEAVEAAGEGIQKPPERWPGYQLKRARLFQLSEHLRDILAAAPAEAEFLTEQPLKAHEGRLLGKPDLLIRSRSVHRVVDYKSGSVIELDSGLPRASYVRQLQLYAFLEFEATGDWPQSAHLFPLNGSPVEVEIEPTVCVALAQEAIDSLERYNEVAPSPQPASPGPEACKYCPHAAACPAFWKSCDVTWAGSVVAVAGWSRRSFRTPVGGVSVQLQVFGGSIGSESLLLRNLDPAIHPEADRITEESEVAAVGLVGEEGRETYRLPAWGLLRVVNGSDPS